MKTHNPMSKQGIAVMGCNTTGPPLSAAIACCPLVSYTMHMQVLQTPTDNSDRC